MGRELWEQSPSARVVFEQVAEATGRDAAALCFELDAETLRQTQNAQLALFTVGVAHATALAERVSVRPHFWAGHSVGEYAALVIAGWLSVADGARLVARRGEIMAAAGTERAGTMAAVLGLDWAALDALCAEASEGEGSVVVVANDNCPGQLVVSGDVDAVGRLGAMAPERGARKVMPLNVSGAFHSPLMVESAAQMGAALAGASWHPGGAVVSNVTAEPGTDWTDLMTRQLKSPVRWTESVQWMIGQGVTRFVECGHGEVLSGLLRRIDGTVTGLKVTDGASLDATAEALNG